MNTVKKNIPVLFENNSLCCGCSACFNACPTKSIKMKKNDYGFVYPVINPDSCINCGICKKVCSYQNQSLFHPIKGAYAVISKNNHVRKMSSSGGLFYELASKFIREGGVVYGAAYSAKWEVLHIKVDNERQLNLLQGSKYCQSDINETYKQVKKDILNNFNVLFSGTPCQIDGLLGYLGKQPDNLFLVDLVCHGVPNNQMFKDYLNGLELKKDGIITDFTFRDKRLGWGINGSYSINNRKKINIFASESSYFSLFEYGFIYRDSCYSCKYAKSERVSDLTIGDFWGVEQVVPEILGKHRWNERLGISLALVNTEKGQMLLDQADVLFQIVDIQSAVVRNAQLYKPVSQKKERKYLLEKYHDGGWEAIDSIFKHSVGIKKYSSRFKALIPQTVKSSIKKLRLHGKR